MLLYYLSPSPYARKVRIVARERALLALIDEVAADPWAEPTDLVAANPLGRIPCLVTDDGWPLFDSPVICAYLDAHPQAGGAQLIPAGDNGWRVRRAEALADGVMDLGVLLAVEKRKPESERSPTMAGRWRRQLARAVGTLLTEVEDLGNAVSLGHFAAACALGYLDFRHPDIDWRTGNDGLAAWYAGFATHPSLAATAPQ
ncbi:MAG: glutathione S-transferase N-terminal domain-containing protein [Rhodospirillales bacterium]|nr:glutathione S-transferase N-terminal domain-containing protein [Rhodospirillales bacterium]